MYNLEYSKVFRKNLKKMSVIEQRTTAEKLKILVENPLHPSLRTKKVQRLKDVYESSINMDIRILWVHKGNRLILLLTIGHHDILG